MGKTKELLADTRYEASEKPKFNLENVSGLLGRHSAFVETMFKEGKFTSEWEQEKAKKLINDFNDLVS